MVWQFVEAERQFDLVLKQALSKGPQRIIQHDQSVIVLSESDYKKLKGQSSSFKAYLFDEGPDFDGLDLERSSLPERDIQL